MLQLFHQPSGAVSGALRYPGFIPSLQGQLVALYANNTTALTYLKKQGGTRSQNLNSVAQTILRLCEVHHNQLLPQFIPGKLNVLADSLSRKLQVLGSEWTLCSEAFHQLLRRWTATIDLCATSLNHRLLVYFSPMVDPQSVGTNAMLQSWDCLQAYAFPPFGLIPRDLELTLVAPFWAQHPWFPDLLVEIPFFLPRRDLLKRLGLGLGCVSGRRPAVWLVVSGLLQLFHQPPGAVSGAIRYPGFSPVFRASLLLFMPTTPRHWRT